MNLPVACLIVDPSYYKSASSRDSAILLETGTSMMLVVSSVPWVKGWVHSDQEESILREKENVSDLNGERDKDSL